MSAVSPSPPLQAVPYPAILQRLQQGKVVPFLGAGASIVDRPEGAEWKHGAEFPPRGAELSSWLASRVEYPSDSGHPEDVRDLLKVAAYYEEATGREALRDEIHGVLARDYRPGPLHRWLAAIDGLKLIVTTNYDTLLERAFRDAKRAFDLVIYQDGEETGSGILHWPNGADSPVTLSAEDLQVDLATTTVIFKMHGTVDDRATPDAEVEDFVITEDDYIDFLCRMTSGSAVPKAFLHYFRSRSFLFLGYSLADWNMRVVLRNLGREFEAHGQRGAVKHWAIQEKPSPVEQWLWKTRGVNVYDERIEMFVEHLKAAQGA